MTLPKTWLDRETLKSFDLNTNFEYLDNILTGGGGDAIGGFSSDVSEMQLTTSPGDVGSESLATTLQGEIERLRFQLDAIIGKDFWYQRPSVNLETLASNFGLQTYNNRIVSGASRANGFPVFLKPNGTNLTLTLDTTTPLEVAIKGTTFVQAVDLTLSMTAAPTVNNTMLLNGARRDSDGELKSAASPLSALIFDAVGSNIVARAKRTIAVSMGGELIMGYLKSAVAGAAYMINAKRGWFFDSALAPIKSVSQIDNASATLLNIGWIFYRNFSGSASIFATYSEPVYSDEAPLSPLFNDMWFNTTTNVWMRFDGIQFLDYDCVMIGYAVCNATACIGARSLEYTASYSATNTIRMTRRNPDELFLIPGGSINVSGGAFQYPESGKIIAKTDLDPDSLALTNGMTVYVYVFSDGGCAVSSIHPNNRDDLLGMYHPFANARCIGSAIYSTFSLPAGEFLLPKLLSNVKNGGIATNFSINTTTTTETEIPASAVSFLWSGNPISVEFQGNNTYYGMTSANNSGSAGFSTYKVKITNLETGLQVGEVANIINPGLNATVQNSNSDLNTTYLLPNGLDSCDPYTQIKVSVFVTGSTVNVNTLFAASSVSVGEDVS